jgi:hypothetical protein
MLGVNGDPTRQTILHSDSDRLHIMANLHGVESGAWAETLPVILDHEMRPAMVIEHRAVWLRDSADPLEETNRLLTELDNLATGYRDETVALTDNGRTALIQAAVKLLAALTDDL